ncbi:MAG: hypothetical protein ACRD0K_30495 [Egibacteraceae bacterium]
MAFHELPALDALLVLWARWVRSYSGRIERGYPRRSIGFLTGGTYGADTVDEAWGTELDIARAQEVEAAVTGLSHAERAAIDNEYGLARVWRHRESHQVVLDRAQGKVLASLRRRAGLAWAWLTSGA